MLGHKRIQPSALTVVGSTTERELEERGRADRGPFVGDLSVLPASQHAPHCRRNVRARNRLDSTSAARTGTATTSFHYSGIVGNTGPASSPFGAQRADVVLRGASCGRLCRTRGRGRATGVARRARSTATANRPSTMTTTRKWTSSKDSVTLLIC